MITDEFRSSQAAIQAPLPSNAHPSSSSPSAPKELPSGPVKEAAVQCVADMEFHTNGMPLYALRNSVAGERDRVGRRGWRSCQPLSPQMIRATPRCFHPHPDDPVTAPDSGPMPDVLPVSRESTVRICTTLHYFALLCSDFAAGSQLQPSENQCLVLPITWTHPRLCRSVFLFWSSFGLVPAPRSHAPMLRRRLKPQISVKMVKKW